MEEWLGLAERASRPKILVVDDQSLNIRLLHELFHQDCDVYMATNGNQAIDKAKELQPDLILLDVVMPGIDGFEVCRRLKLDLQTSQIPIIFITANFDEEDEVKGFELGGADFIHKPINPTITRARVQTHLALKRQADQLRSIALIDGLTGLANRRQFDQALNSAWQHCQRKQLEFSLILLDVDYFKRFNDQYGHQLGDTCLQLIAQSMKSVLKRAQDTAARYGGEEFACILPGTNAEGASFIADEILTAVQQLKIEHAASHISEFVTVSMGVATIIPRSGFEPQQLIEVADQQLYCAKEAGRARVCSCEI